MGHDPSPRFTLLQTSEAHEPFSFRRAASISPMSKVAIGSIQVCDKSEVDRVTRYKRLLGLSWSPASRPKPKESWARRLLPLGGSKDQPLSPASCHCDLRPSDIRPRHSGLQ